MHVPAFVLSILVTATLAAQQEPKPPDPIALVAAAEQRCKKGEIEEGVQMLWQALALLEGKSPHPVRAAAALSANQLLAAHDPLFEAHRGALRRIAQLQVELATAYRNKKWLDTAAQRLEIAARYDATATEKEAAALERAMARRKPKDEPKEEPAPAPEVKVNPFYDRDRTLRVLGNWKIVGDELLECAAHDGGNALFEWITQERHEDGEFRVAVRGTEVGKPFNATLSLGNGDVGTAYRVHAICEPGHVPTIGVTEVKDNVFRSLGQVGTQPKFDAEGYWHLVVRVRGSRITVIAGDGDPLEVDAGAPVRGFVGFTVGVRDLASCPVQFRQLRIGPLPADAPTDDELREQRQQELQASVLAAVDRATALLAAKDPEAAAVELRSARFRAMGMPAGILRDNLVKSIDATLQKADPIAARRTKVAGECAAALVEVADRHAEAGRARLALALVLTARDFDPDGLAERLVRAEADVAAWNLAQAKARAAELAPPVDDGAVLREWFAAGKRLDSRRPPWVVEGAAARVDQMPGGEISALMPAAGRPAVTKAKVAVRLPAKGLAAGFCFDAAGPHDYAVALIERDAKGLVLFVFRYRNGKWTRLASKAAPSDAWRLDGWFELSFETTAAGVVVRAAGVELALDKGLFGVGAGRLGLCASSNAAEPVTVEFRAFGVGP